MLLTRFRFIWLIGFRIEDFLEIDLWWPCLLMHRDVISNLYNRPSIDASYKVLVHLPKQFQRRRFLLTNQKQELPVTAMFIIGSRRNEQSLQRIFHRCFLTSFSSFGQAVSDEKNLKNRPIKNKNFLWRPCLLYLILPTKFKFIWQRGFRGED